MLQNPFLIKDIVTNVRVARLARLAAVAVCALWLVAPARVSASPANQAESRADSGSGAVAAVPIEAADESSPSPSSGGGSYAYPCAALTDLEVAFDRASAAYDADPSPETEAAYRQAGTAVLSSMEACYHGVGGPGSVARTDGAAAHGAESHAEGLTGNDADVADAAAAPEGGAGDPLVRFDYGGMMEGPDGKAVPGLNEFAPVISKSAGLEWNLRGRKWGPGTPYTGGAFSAGPRIPGGTVTYSFMDSGIGDPGLVDFGPGTTTALAEYPGFSACMYDEIVNAFKIWEAVADIQFVEVPDNGAPFDSIFGFMGNIRIAMHVFDGPGGTLAHAYFPPPTFLSAAGDMHFDVADNWTCDHRTAGAFDIGITAVHEIGHSIGLNHETTVNAIMEPFYNPTIDDQTVFFNANLAVPRLHRDDATGAQEIYSAALADVRIEKSSSPNPAVAGRPLYYTLTVTNEGPNTATGVTVVDDLPLGLTFIDVTQGGTSSPACNLSAGTGPNGEDQLTCLVDDLGVGDSRSFEIKTSVPAGFVRAEADGTRVVENRAVVDTYAEDPDLGNNIANERTLVEDRADLRVIKLVEPHTTVRAGDTFTYTIYVDNLGPSSARNATIIDTLLSSGNVRINSCSFSVFQGGGSITQFGCLTGPHVSTLFGTDVATFKTDWLDPLSPNSLGRLRASFVLEAQNDIDVNNMVRVTSDTPDPDTDNNMALSGISVTASADLQITDPDDPDPVFAGNQLTYTINITNTGPSVAENVVVEDNLPAEVEVVSVTASSGACAAGTPGDPFDPTTCNFDTVPSGGSRTMTVVTRVSPDAVTDVVTDEKLIHNDVIVYSDTFDPDNSDNIDHETTTVQASADLSLQKFKIGIGTVAGEEFHYEIQVRNDGPSVSRDVVLRDFLPDGVEFINAFVDYEGGLGGVPLACEVTLGSNAVFCPLGDIPLTGDDIPPTADAPILVFFNVRLNPSIPEGMVLNNVADVSLTDTPDADTGNNSDDADLTAGSRAELRVSKRAMRLDPAAGTKLIYQISVTNDGPSDAWDVVVTDTLPAGFVYEADSDSCTETALGTLVCRPAGSAPDYVLAVGQTVTFDVLVEIDPGRMPTAANNRVCADADNAVVVCADAEVNVDRIADLRVRKWGKPDDAVRAGETLTYTLFVDNLGPSFTAGVVVTDEMRSDHPFFLLGIRPDVLGVHGNASCTYYVWDPVTRMALSSDTVTTNPATAITTPIDVSTGQLRISCVNPETMETFWPTYDEGRWIVDYAVKSNITSSLNNVASVSGPDPDPDPSNNEAEVSHDITDVADLWVEKGSVGQVQLDGCPAGAGELVDEVTAGLPITWTIAVGNLGPSPAENTKIIDRLPPWITVTGYDVQDATGATVGSCTTGMPGSALDRLICGLDTIDPTSSTASVTVTLQGVVDPSTPEGTILENDVQVMSDIFDPDNSNDYDSTLTVVNTRADLMLSKLDDPDPVVAGEMLKYTLIVTNFGASDASLVRIVDELPDEVVYVSAGYTPASDVQGACAYDAATHDITCSVAVLPVGRTAIVDVYVQVKPDAVPSGLGFVDIDNTATVTSDTQDTCPANNVEVETTRVNRQADLYIEKSDTPDPVLAGSEVTYTITFGNTGSSTATSVSVIDTLPAGLTPLRCESVEPADQVTCAVVGVPGGTVTLEEIRSGGAVVWEDFPPNGPLNDLDPGEEYSFRIVALVDSGYVLDGLGDTGPGEACEGLFLATGWSHFAHNRADVASLTDAASIDECTRVDAAADLALDKTDIFTDDFLECDPVEPGGTVTYVLTVTNQGPSDAAVVHVVDWLPAAVVHDPARVEVVPSAGEVVEIRDDGRITVRLGDAGGVAGRMDAGETETITIRAIVRLDAKCGSDMHNAAYVETREDTTGAFAAGDTPTPDPDLTNNADAETTRIECASVEIDKTVSYDGTCPGTDAVTTVRQGQPVTFCLEITNTGTTYLDEIVVEDILSTRREPGGIVVFTDTIRSGLDPLVPVAPGETVRRQYTIERLDCNCGIAENEARVVSAIPTNAGRTPLTCITGPTDADSAQIFVPCGGADLRLQLPVLETEECEVWLQIQNLGNVIGRGVLVLWGEAGACPPQAAGPLKVECTGLLKPGSAWTMLSESLPAGARSGIMYSVDALTKVDDGRGNKIPFADLVCGSLFREIVGDHDEWLRFDLAYTSESTYFGRKNPITGEQTVLDFGAYRGEPMAVSVNRNCPDPVDDTRRVNAAYAGVSSDQEGAVDPFFGGYGYYAPMVFAEKSGLSSKIYVHNSGTICTSLELWFRTQDNCLRPMLGDVLSVAPGETHVFDPSTAVGPDWVGSAWIRASQPLGVIVETLGPNHFTSYRASPADTSNEWSVGSQVNYAPLIYSEYQGWDTALVVQNLDPVVAAKVKVYFLDRGGAIITTLVDWICPRGSQTFFLPVIESLPGNWVGSARVESQEWITSGGPRVDAPYVQTVVLLEKWSDPARTERREAVAYNGLTEKISYDWQIAPFTHGGLTSGVGVIAVPLVAKQNRGVTSELAITNLVPKPGFTDFAIYFFDQNGYLDRVCEKLNEKQVEYIDLASWGIVPPRFLGSAVISATFWEHDVFDDRGRFERNLVGLSAVVVERVGGTLSGEDVPGDESKAFEGIPVFHPFGFSDAARCPGIPSLE